MNPNSKHERAGEATLTSGKIDSRSRTISKDRDVLSNNRVKTSEEFNNDKYVYLTTEQNRIKRKNRYYLEISIIDRTIGQNSSNDIKHYQPTQSN